MRSPRTAKDDQPGPIGRRHNSTGGDLDQSVSICTPRTTPSRLGPRKPGHSALVLTLTSARSVERAAASLPAGAGTRFSTVSAAAGAGAGGVGASLARRAGRLSGISAAGAGFGAAGVLRAETR